MAALGTPFWTNKASTASMQGPAAHRDSTGKLLLLEDNKHFWLQQLRDKTPRIASCRLLPSLLGASVEGKTSHRNSHSLLSK